MNIVQIRIIKLPEAKIVARHSFQRYYLAVECARCNQSTRILDTSSFVASVALLYFFCKPVVFHYEGTFIATVKAFPNRRAIKDEKIDVCGTAFWTVLPSSQDSLLFLGSLDRFLEFPLLFP